MAAFVDFVGYPVGADVFVDNKKIGVLPKYYHLLKWGKYQIRCEKEGFEPEFRKDFRVFKTDKRKTVVFRLKKKIKEE